jgi:hypothetical protein
MEEAVQVTPIALIPNTSRGILDYLVQRTDDTIGKQVERSRAIIIGRVQESEARSVSVRPADVRSLRPWLSGEAGVGPAIVFGFTGVEVEEWLFGSGKSGQINIVYPYPAEEIMGGPDAVPIFSVGERGLLFLTEVAPDVPYASYIPRPAYQLAPTERWVHNFLVTDYDDQGQPFTRDETAQVEETIAALKWYIALPPETDRPGAFQQALLQALDSANTKVVHQAIRALADRGDSATAKVFKRRLQKADEELRVRLMLGLWILGETEAAEDILEELFRLHGYYPWLALWDVKPTVVKKGESVTTLYGPDPSKFKGD